MRLIKFIIIVQLILFAAHWIVCETWLAFQNQPHPRFDTGVKVAMAILSVTFVPASLLSFRYSNFWTRWFYKFSAVWLGILNYLVLAAFLFSVADLGERLIGSPPDRPALLTGAYGLAIFIGLCGLLNARWIRVRTIKVTLPNLPPTWHGRTAAMVSDLHLGHVNGRRFVRKIVARLRRLEPDVVFIVGDLFDGVRLNVRNLADEWKQISPRLGNWFVTGNHEEFSDPARFLEPLRDAGVCVLNNERATVDGLDIVGVPYRDSVQPERLRSILQGVGLDRNCASILLAHSPNALQIAEEEGISLQLSGHTHGGQFFPFTLLVKRIYRQYAYGLNPLGELMVYTSSGCGTWGPPMRMGARPEIVIIEFE